MGLTVHAVPTGLLFEHLFKKLYVANYVNILMQLGQDENVILLLKFNSIVL